MKLDEYLRINNLTEQAFALLIGTSQATVNRYRNGRIPEPDAMDRIVKATSGAVTPNDFYGFEPPADDQKGALLLQPPKYSADLSSSKSCSLSGSAAKTPTSDAA